VFVVVLDHNFEVSKPSALQHRSFHYQLGAPKRSKLTAVVKMFIGKQIIIAVLVSTVVRNTQFRGSNSPYTSAF